LGLCESDFINKTIINNIPTKNEGGMPKVLPLSSTIVDAEKGVTAVKRYKSFVELSLNNQNNPKGTTIIPSKVNNGHRPVTVESITCESTSAPERQLQLIRLESGWGGEI
jgi:hypothetical protein